MMHHKTIITPPIQTTDYLIGENLLGHLHTQAPLQQPYDKFLLISDETVFSRYGQTVREGLQQTGKPIITSLVPAGENSKRFETIQSVVQPFFEAGISKKSLVLALGGGMITDLAGFIASILLRGTDAIYLPTTLLAQVDAAIGGKTGVDYWLDETRMYKNMIGTIRQPVAVISDVGVLQSLPKSEIESGLGEMVKYWIGWGKPTVKELHNLGEVSSIISTCQNIKIDILEQDPYETLGVRDKLNLGHTIGHGIEAAAGGTLSHGQSVAIGCVAAANISVAMGKLDQSIADTIEQTITDLGLPTRAPGLSADSIQERMRLDKKEGTFVLIHDIGTLESRVSVPTSIVNTVINTLIQ